jgi:hypothetical protein
MKFHVVQLVTLLVGHDASGSFLMLNACATILETLDPFADHPL